MAPVPPPTSRRRSALERSTVRASVRPGPSEPACCDSPVQRRLIPVGHPVRIGIHLIGIKRTVEHFVELLQEGIHLLVDLKPQIVAKVIPAPPFTRNCSVAGEFE